MAATLGPQLRKSLARLGLSSPFSPPPPEPGRDVSETSIPVGKPRRAVAPEATRGWTHRVEATDPVTTGKAPVAPPDGSVFSRVAVVGAPNAGKSSLINSLVGCKVAMVSRKKQATRRRATVVLTDVDRGAQLAFVDTPGLFPPEENHRLRRPFSGLVAGTLSSLEDGVDHVLVVADAARSLVPGGAPTFALEALAKVLRSLPGSVGCSLALTKMDLLADLPHGRDLASRREASLLGALGRPPGSVPVFRVSGAHSGSPAGTAQLKSHLLASAPPGPWAYPSNMLVDMLAEDFAAEVVRERIYHNLHSEVPYMCEQTKDGWLCRPSGIDIFQTILAPSKGVVGAIVGKGGETITRIRESSEVALSAQFKMPVRVHLTVKVKPEEMKKVASKADGGEFAAVPVFSLR